MDNPLKFLLVTRGDAFRCASRLPLAIIFRAFGALRRDAEGRRIACNAVQLDLQIQVSGGYIIGKSDDDVRTAESGNGNCADIFNW